VRPHRPTEFFPIFIKRNEGRGVGYAFYVEAKSEMGCATLCSLVFSNLPGIFSIERERKIKIIET